MVKSAWIKLTFLTLLCFFFSGCWDKKKTTQGYVEGRYTYVASNRSGYLEYLAVHDGQPVKAGQLLFKLSAQPEKSLVREAKSHVMAQSETSLNLSTPRRQSVIQSLESHLAAAKAQRVYARRMYNRNQILYKRGAIGESKRDKSLSAYAVAKGNWAALRADLLTARLGAREHEQKAQKYQVQAAKAALNQHRWFLSKKKAKARRAGRVEQTFYRESEFVPAGRPVVSYLVPRDVKIVFYSPEPELGQLQVGQVVRFQCDGCKPGQATIDFIASQADYTPPVLFTEQSRKNLVYRVEAQISAKDALQYHPGQPVDIQWPRPKGDA